jgi:hypothetical protein
MQLKTKYNTVRNIYRRDGGNNFYFPPPQRKFLATTHEIKTLFWFVYIIFILNLEAKYRKFDKMK